MSHLTTGIPSEKRVIGTFSHRIDIVECTFTNRDGMAYSTHTPPSHMWSVVDQHIVTQHRTVGTRVLLTPFTHAASTVECGMPSTRTASLAAKGGHVIYLWLLSPKRQFAGRFLIEGAGKRGVV